MEIKIMSHIETVIMVAVAMIILIEFLIQHISADIGKDVSDTRTVVRVLSTIGFVLLVALSDIVFGYCFLISVILYVVVMTTVVTYSRVNHYGYNYNPMKTWWFHNLVAHPMMEIMYRAGLERLGNSFHDYTQPVKNNTY